GERRAHGPPPAPDRPAPAQGAALTSEGGTPDQSGDLPLGEAPQLGHLRQQPQRPDRAAARGARAAARPARARAGWRATAGAGPRLPLPGRLPARPDGPGGAPAPASPGSPPSGALGPCASPPPALGARPALPTPGPLRQAAG